MPDLDNLPQDEEARVEGAKLFAETIAAHGGDAFLAQSSLKIIGRAIFTTPPQTGGLKIPLSSFTLSIATGGRSRLEARAPGTNILFVNRGNGRGGFVILVGRTLQLPAEQCDGIEVTELLRTTAQQNYPIFAVPDAPEEKTEDGKTLLRYDIHTENDRAIQVYIESDTKLVRKVFFESTRGAMTMQVGNYQSTPGFPMFYEMEMLENGSSIIKLIASEVSVDVPFADKLFTEP